MSVYAGLRPYQIVDVLGAEKPAWGFYYRPRMGKTLSALRCAQRWTAEFDVKIVLVVGPLTPLEVTWVPHAEKNGFVRGENLLPLLYPPSGQSKLNWVTDEFRTLDLTKPTMILLNDDMLSAEGEIGPRGGTRNITDLLVDLARKAPMALVRDEAHRDLNAGSARAQCLRRLGRYTKFRRALTGTPDPNGYVNLYSQFAILDPDIFGTDKTKFMDRYVVTRDLYRREIVGYQNTEELLAKVRSISTIVRPEDFFTVPTIERIDRRIELGKGVRALYKRLRDDKVLEEYDLATPHRLAHLTRLQQLATGYLPVEDPEAEPVTWVHDKKIESVVADLAEPLYAGQKIVVSHRWRPEGERLAAALRKKYGERAVHELNGRTKTDRAEIVAPFSLDADVQSEARIMVAQEKAGGVGISFGRADHLHFLSWSFDYGDVDQMSQRTFAVEKLYLTETFHVVRGTVDSYARALVRRKASATLMLKTVGYENAANGEVENE